MIRGEVGRRGLSPLIATILLIAFAAALGTLVMSWALPGGEIRQPTDPCAGVAIELQQLPGAEAICYNQNSRELRFIVKNTGTTDISMLRLRVTNSQFDITERDIKADLASGGAGDHRLEYNVASPNNIIATIIPLVESGSSVRACPQAEIEQTQIPVC